MKTAMGFTDARLHKMTSNIFMTAIGRKPEPFYYSDEADFMMKSQEEWERRKLVLWPANPFVPKFLELDDEYSVYDLQASTEKYW